MSVVKGLSGFIVGLGVGGAAVTGVATFVEPVEKLAFLQSSDAEQAEAAKEADPVETEAEVVEPAVAPDVAASTEPQEPETPQKEVKEEPAQKEEEVAVVAPEPAPEPKEDVLETEAEAAEPEQATVETPEPAPEKPEERKIKLPTITPETPTEPAEQVVEEPVRDEGIKIGKKPNSSLPSISQEEPAPDAPAEVEEVADGNALEFNAVKFEATDRPLMGVILEDIGDKGLEIEKLKTLNAPLTIAIRADASDASERALAYRAAGFEVIAMAPEGRAAALNAALNPGQVNDALDVLFTSVPNAVGLIDNPLAGLQKNGRTSDVVVDSFVETGHGLVTYAKGLNSVDRSASAKGVKAAKVGRILDQNRENKALIARYLDRISLDAGRDGTALVLGTTAKDTVAALAGWILSAKGQSVAIAPASAVLMKQ